MSNQKYLLVYRNPANAPMTPPSPDGMQQIIAAWKGWMEKSKGRVLDLGDALKPPGKVISRTGVTDGPFIEAKEVVGGYSIISAESYEEAVEIAKSCPVLMDPTVKIEIRELMGFGDLM